MFHDMSAPSSRIKSKEKEKSENSLLKHLTVSNTCVAVFFKQNKQIILQLYFKKRLLLWEVPLPSLHPAVFHTGHQFSNLKAGSNKELLATRFGHNTRNYYCQSQLVYSFLVLNFNFPEDSSLDSIQKEFLLEFFSFSLRKQLR